ncbi:MAG: hypothetical protein ACJAVI_000126 [Candidatus Azotimanducaceae bacterium]|jgi:hypothetical protein
MARSFWIKAHLFVASFFAPALLVTAISGGLYLVDVKGSVTETKVDVPVDMKLDLESSTLEEDVRLVFEKLGIEHDFEYLRIGGSTITTRPTSRTSYVLEVYVDGIAISRNDPDLQKRLIELHKGHGPRLFKDFQKVMAVALLFVLLSGAWLGLSSTGLRTKTAVTVSSGLIVFLALVLFA